VAAKRPGVSLGSYIIYGILRLSVLAVLPRDVIIRNMLTTVIPNTAERVVTAAATAAAAEGG